VKGARSEVLTVVLLKVPVSGLLRCVNGYIVCDISWDTRIVYGSHDPEDEGTAILRNVRKSYQTA